ncbi:hypothetical protein PGQ11_007521 [Apiospora arundinis]|uniref:Uncharacterized protein n=1 Tax=Apiospora arundinis TaxID=335852 RepID=A0ABR2IWV4_9PEZI
MDSADYTAAIMSNVESNGVMAVGHNPHTGCSFHIYLRPELFDMGPSSRQPGPPLVARSYFQHNLEHCICDPLTHYDRWYRSTNPYLMPPFLYDLQRSLRLQLDVVPRSIDNNGQEMESAQSVAVEAEEIVQALGDLRVHAAAVVACGRAIGLNMPGTPDRSCTIKARLFVSDETRQAELRLESNADEGQHDAYRFGPALNGWYKGLRRTLGSLA